MYNIRKAAVIGSGVMGAGIAGQLANAGIKVVLLDIVPVALTEEEQKKGLTLNDKAVRNRIVFGARDKMADKKSTYLYTQDNIDLITFGNIEDDLVLLKEADLVVEVVVENIDIKKELYEKIVPLLKDRAILSTNTSGISINDLSEVLPDELKKRFLVTHFFNPVRFMKLLELVPSKYTDIEVIEYMQEFCENKLGKGIVNAKDTPGFVANRFGTYALAIVLQKALEHKLSIEEADALTGKEIGRPNTGTFRLYDLIGLDTGLNVLTHLKNNADSEHEKSVLDVPCYFRQLVEKGHLGDKTKQGFYKRVKADTLVVDFDTFEYRPKQKVESETLVLAKKVKNLKEKVNIMINGQDQTGIFMWDVIKHTLLFAASMIPEISDDIESIDNSMKWGYNWEVGPFELWDLIGVRESVERMKVEGDIIPPFVTELLDAGRDSFYEGKAIQDGIKRITPMVLRNQGNTILACDAASLVDMGDGVACFLLHSKNSTVYSEVFEFVHKALAEVEKSYVGMVFASTGKNFCVGGNLRNMLQQARENKWEILEKEVSDFQKMNMALKYFNRPIVAAPYGMTLGGGTELTIHCSKVRAHAETNIGLVEIGVGILPAGGGTKELLIRLTEDYSDNTDLDIIPFILQAHRLITSAQVSKSEPDAKKIGFLKKTDTIAMNKDLQLAKAKADVLNLADTFVPRNPAKKYRVGGETTYALIQNQGYQKWKGNFVSEYDYYLMNKIGYVLCGGRIRENSFVTEQYLLDLELEAYMSLTGEQKSQDRMEHMLKTGKALKN